MVLAAIVVSTVLGIFATSVVPSNQQKPVAQTPTITPTTSPSPTSSWTPALDSTTTVVSSPSPATATITPDRGTGGRIGSCPMFPPDNIWNRNIASLPVDANSETYIRRIGMDAPLHTAFAAAPYRSAPLGMPFITVTSDQERFPMKFNYASESDPGPYPVPLAAPIEGGAVSTGDRHVLVVDKDACVLYELYKARPNGRGGWEAGSGARWDLNSNALRPDGWTSADAAGLPILPALVRYEEVESGAILHALRFTAPSTRKAHVWPARHNAGESHDPELPPMGIRVRLKGSVNISGFPEQARVILQALKDYGMFLADNGDPPWNIDGTPDSRWNDQALKALERLRGTDLEVVDQSGLVIDPDSGQSR